MSYGARKDFYQSKLWKQSKKEIWIRQNLLCGICGKPVYVDGISDYIPKEHRRTGIVHHIKHLDNNNVYDYNISINPDNLIGVCLECHNSIHNEHNSLRPEYSFDEYGNLVSSKSRL